MEKTGEDLLCCPSCRGELVPDEAPMDEENRVLRLRCKTCGKRYEQKQQWIDFINDQGIVFKTRREKFFRSLLSRVYTPATNMMFLLCGGPRSARNAVMERVRVKDGDSVLETGAGYGENFQWLSRHYSGLTCHGLDIQDQMLSHCARNLKRWNIKATLVKADAQSLPYRDNAFDVVFHLGAINLFDDKHKAISEMIRVAKAGTHIVIADESQKAGRLFNLFTGAAEKVIPPVNLVPPEMQNISLHTIWKGYGYLIEFDVVK